MIVLDASAAIELLLNTRSGRLVRSRVSDSDETLHAPHLIAVEVAQVLRRFARSGIISAEVGADALADLADLDIEHYATEPLLPRIWTLRHNMTAYDATYLALAEVLEAPLLTLDIALAGAPGHSALIELIQ